MGTGKSTVGRQMARRLGFRFFDSDREIEHAQGRPIADLFAAEGEAAFRGLEKKFIESGHSPVGCVVACGGGLVVPAGMRELLGRRGVVVCLHASAETLLRRTTRTGHRPLLQGSDRETRVRELLAAREKIYRAAGTLVLTDGQPVREVVAHVLRIYRRETRERSRR